MQATTRIGIGLGVVLVAVAGYFFYTAAKPEPIEIDGGKKAAKKTETKALPVAGKPKSETDRKAAQNKPPVRRAQPRPSSPSRQAMQPSPYTRRPAGVEQEPQTDTLRLPRQVAREPKPEHTPAAARAIEPESTRTSTPVETPTVTRSPDERLGPSAPVANAVLPASPTPSPMREHVVKAGDTFSSLAVEYYGSQRHVQYLIAANPQVTNPNALKIGMKLKIPPPPSAQQTPTVATKESAQPAPVAGPNQYVIKPGDSFYTIAESKLGDGRRWPEIYEINKELFPDGPHTIRPGVVISLSEQAGR